MPQDFFHQLLEFTVRHWWMVAAFVAAIVLLLIEEVRSKALSASQLSPQELTYRMNRNQVVVIDVREVQAYRDGHIINAINIPASDIERDSNVVNQYKEKAIVLVDANGSKATALSTMLGKKEFAQVSVLRGGIATWRQDNMPLVKGK